LGFWNTLKLRCGYLPRSSFIYSAEIEICHLKWQQRGAYKWVADNTHSHFPSPSCHWWQACKYWRRELAGRKQW